MRNIFVQRSRLQHKYLRVIVLSLITPTFIAVAALYHLIIYLLQRHIAIPEFMVYTILPVIRKINMGLAVTLPIVFLILFGVGVVISNRLAGPVERITKELEELASGKRTKKIYVRKQDELKPLIESINRIIEKGQEKG